MERQLVRRTAALGMALLFWGVVAFAQDQTLALKLEPTSGGASTNQVASLLEVLPEADSLLYINPQRILNEVVPKIMPEGELAKLRQQFNDLKLFVGVDPSRIDYIVMAIRFRRPAADLQFSPPEFLVVTGGDFSADSLMTVARLALQEKISEEKHGSKMLALMNIDEIARQSEKNPILTSYTQLGFAALGINTIAAGNVGYLRAAIDASEGRDRINPETLNTLLRDPNAIISLAGSPRSSFARAFGLLGTETNPRASTCESKLGDFYAAITMEGTIFKLRGAVNADNPDTAKIINSLLSGALRTAARTSTQDKSAQTALQSLNIAAQDNEVRLEADIPQQVVADFVRQQMKPKPADTDKKPAAKPIRKRRLKRP